MSTPSNQTRAEFDEEEALLYRGMLRKLTEMAMNMAANIHDEATAPPTPNTPEPDHTIQFERVSRTIRRCILLARKLAEPLPQPRPILAADRIAARKHIIRGVEDAIHRRHIGDEPEIEALEAELMDRLDRPDLENDIATRPIEDIIADLARDLKCGYHPTDRKFGWKRRTPGHIEVLEARAAAPTPAASRTTPSQGPPQTNAA